MSAATALFQAEVGRRSSYNPNIAQFFPYPLTCLLPKLNFSMTSRLAVVVNIVPDAASLLLQSFAPRSALNYFLGH